MNIIVTTPKSEIENSKKEGKAVEENGGYWFRVFKYRPKVNINDKIFFVENGFITGYGIIFDIEQLKYGQECDVTGRIRGKPGYWIIKYNNWHWLENKIQMKGFQGIRYINNLPVEIQKGLK